MALVSMRPLWLSSVTPRGVTSRPLDRRLTILVKTLILLADCSGAPSLDLLS